MVVTGTCDLNKHEGQNLSQFHSSFQATNHGSPISLYYSNRRNSHTMQRCLETPANGVRDITKVEPRGLEPLTPCLQSDGIALAEPR